VQLVLMMKRKHLPEQDSRPVRTCLGCGEKTSKKRLLRFVAGQNGLVELDLKGILPGRGIYCCPNYSCLSGFMKKSGKMLRALRITRIDCSSILPLVEKYRMDIADCSN
jgi:predicted RNA-binding protein YlxR (DUF448 family)